jgi:hypothetical protein
MVKVSLKEDIINIYFVNKKFIDNEIINLIINQPDRENYKKFIPKEYHILL